jgi:hypothetical protein
MKRTGKKKVPVEEATALVPTLARRTLPEISTNLRSELKTLTGRMSELEEKILNNTQASVEMLEEAERRSRKMRDALAKSLDKRFGEE